MRQLFREFVVARRRSQEESDRDLVLAWHTAAMTRAKKLPNIKELLSERKRGPAKRQTWQEQKAAIAMISARFKIPVQRMKLSEITHG